MAEEPAMRDQAEAVLSDARARMAQAQAQGRSYAVALHQTRAAQALVALGEPAAALTELDQAAAHLDMLAVDGEYERLQLLRAISPGLPPIDAESSDLGSLRAMVAVTRAVALTRLHSWADARAAVETARPMVKGWRRRELRRTLDALSDDIARADGSPREALAAIDRTLHDSSTVDADKVAARYERAAHLADEGHYDDAMREALTVIRDGGDDVGVAARARQILGACLAAQGRRSDAAVALSAAFEGFCQTDDDAAVVAAGPGLAWLLGEMGEHQRAVTVLLTSLDSARRRGDLPALVDLESALGTTYDLQGNSGEAIAAFHRAIANAMHIPDAMRAADAQHGEAIVRAQLADKHEAVEALTLLDAAAQTYTAQGLPERAAECQHESAALLARLGSFAAARARYATAHAAYLAIPEVLRGDDADAVPDCERNLALLDALIGRPDTPVPAGAFASGGHHMRHDSAVS